MRLVLTHHPRFRRAALEEAAEVSGGLEEIERPEPSVTVVEFAAENQEVLGRTVFVQHVAPADQLVGIDGSPDDVAAIREGTRSLADRISGRFAVQCRRGAHSGGASHAEAAYSTRDVEIAVGSAIEDAGATVDLDRPQIVLSIYLAASTAYCGLSAAAHNKRPLIPQHHRYSMPPVICRAERKLEEAIDLWDLGASLRGANVLDVGASPGGWSWVLAGAGARVTAVDPGELDPRVTAQDAVSHLRQRAEGLEMETPQFDWVVNDMNVDPPLAAEVLLKARPWLREDGRSVTTLKLAGRSRPRGILAEFVSRLEPGYVMEAAQHLYANRQEVTLLLRRS